MYECSGNHERVKKEINLEGILYGEVLMGRRLFVTIVEVVLNVVSVRCRSRLKGVYRVALLGVSNSLRPVLGIPR